MNPERLKPSGGDMSDKALKKAILVGMALGAVFTLGTALAMDLFFSDTLQGTWRDAAQKDVTRMFGPACGQNWFAVTLVLLFVMTFLAGFGGLLGAAAGVIMNRLFNFLNKRSRWSAPAGPPLITYISLVDFSYQHPAYPECFSSFSVLSQEEGNYYPIFY